MVIWLIRLLILLGGITLSGAIAFGSSLLAAETGMAGSCFEGACYYMAMFIMFPGFWLGLLVAFFVGWIWYARRRRS